MVICTVLRTLIDQVQDLYLLLFVPGPSFFRADRVQWAERDRCGCACVFCEHDWHEHCRFERYPCAAVVA